MTADDGRRTASSRWTSGRAPAAEPHSVFNLFNSRSAGIRAERKRGVRFRVRPAHAALTRPGSGKRNLTRRSPARFRQPRQRIDRLAVLADLELNRRHAAAVHTDFADGLPLRDRVAFLDE